MNNSLISDLISITIHNQELILANQQQLLELRGNKWFTPEAIVPVVAMFVATGVALFGIVKNSKNTQKQIESNLRQQFLLELHKLLREFPLKIQEVAKFLDTKLCNKIPKLYHLEFIPDENLNNNVEELEAKYQILGDYLQDIILLIHKAFPEKIISDLKDAQEEFNKSMEVIQNYKNKLLELKISELEHNKPIPLKVFPIDFYKMINTPKDKLDMLYLRLKLNKIILNDEKNDVLV